MSNRPVNNAKLPPHLVLTAILSGGITTAFSLIYILLGIAYFIFQTQCDYGSTIATTGDVYFWTTIFRVYVLSSQCIDEKLAIDSLMDESTLYILMWFTLTFSILCLIAAICLIIIVQEGTRTNYLLWIIIGYITSCVGSLAVDITTASFFGIDYSCLTSSMRNRIAGSPSNYLLEVIRQGAFWLMTIALKGYVAHLINCVLLILLAVYYYDYEKYIKTVQHSIHKLGVLNAFEQRQRAEETWPKQEMYNNNLSPSRSTYLHSGFMENDTPPRSPMQPEPLRSDYRSNQSYDRSDSWQHSQNHSVNSRPFSYLEDVKRPTSSKPPPPSPAAEPSWRNNQWPKNSPPVPAPDYSPQPRRLKSALKPAYM